MARALRKLGLSVIPLAAIAAELAREAAARRRTYPALIDKGRLTTRDAEFEHAALAALAADVALMMAPPAPCPALGGLPLIPLPSEATHGQSWQARRDALHRELDRRARLYPGWIDTGRITAADAAHQTACLEALLTIYDEGWGWTPPREYPPLSQGWTVAMHQARDADWQAAWSTTRTAATRGQTAQQALAL